MKLVLRVDDFTNLEGIKNIAHDLMLQTELVLHLLLITFCLLFLIANGK